MLAQSIKGRCHLFREKLELGLSLIRKMAVNIPSTKSELSLLTGIYTAIKQMDSQDNKRSSIDSSDSPEHGYANFKKWAVLWKGQRSATSNKADEMWSTNTSTATPDMQNIFGDFSWSPLFDMDMSNTIAEFGSGDTGLPPYLDSSTTIDSGVTSQ